ncbi:serine hydroxymethyltransferase, mitochondrial [Trifolium repens]|nr:serine hydroxymethyltransferase, mitochondrial [Trifolium repens]
MVFIGQIHHHRQKRALEVFMLGSAKWRVNDHLLSGSPSNFHVSAALLKPHGGHLSHEYQVLSTSVIPFLL